MNSYNKEKAAEAYFNRHNVVLFSDSGILASADDDEDCVECYDCALFSDKIDELTFAYEDAKRKCKKIKASLKALEEAEERHHACCIITRANDRNAIRQAITLAEED